MKHYSFNKLGKVAGLWLMFYGVQIASAQEIAGTWKISDVQLLKKNRSGSVNSENCYLCDLYHSGYGLVFSADGTVAYEESRNNYQVKYTFSANKLTLYLADENADDKAQKQVSFSAELKGNNLILTRVTAEITEIYHLQKQ